MVHSHGESFSSPKDRVVVLLPNGLNGPKWRIIRIKWRLLTT